MMVAAVLAGCSLMGRQDAAPPAPVAPPMAGYFQRAIAAGDFSFVAYEKIRMPGQVATVYIGGAGTDAGVAPALAGRDKSPNVIYLTRLCGKASCGEDRRSGLDTNAAVSQALDTLKAAHKFYGFNLVGFASGAAVAALVAAQREDILSLRTVAGHLDTVVYARLRDLPPPDKATNPAGVAPRLLPLAQKHFIGGRDTVVSAAIGNSYIEASGRADCLSLTVVEKAAHTEGWAEVWPDLLEQPLEGGCGG